jgi:hypothetical protein
VATQPNLITTLAKAYNQRQGALKGASGDAIGKLWDLTVKDPTDATADLWVARAGSVDRAYRLSAAQLAQAYVANVETAMTGQPFSGQVIDPQEVASAVRNGVPMEDQWMRPMVRLRTLLGSRPLGEALMAARQYAAAQQATNTQLAEREGARAAMATSQRIVGYRRVTDGNACQFCLLASTQRYHFSALMPLHGGSCGCTTVPIIGSKDPGRVIDKELHTRLKSAGLDIKDDTDLEAEYSRTVVVQEHGELGPVLAMKGQNFTGPSDITMTPAQRAKIKAADVWRKNPTTPKAAKAMAKLSEGQAEARQQRAEQLREHLATARGSNRLAIAR